MDTQPSLPEDSQSDHATPSDRLPKKDICIIGGGPCGLAALRVVLDHPLFKSGLWRPVLFEARDAIGGVWWALSAPPSVNVI